MLKNKNQALPLTYGKKVALFGNQSYDLITVGGGSGTVYEAYSISLNQGLSNHGYKLDRSLQTSYKKYLANEKARLPKRRELFSLASSIPEMPVNKSVIQNAAKLNNAAIITIGRFSSEGMDRKVSSFYLSKKSRRSLKMCLMLFMPRAKKLLLY